MSTSQPPITKQRLEALLDLALEHASHSWNALENGFQYCPTCGWFGEASKPDIQSDKWAVCPTCHSLVFRVSIGKRVDPDMWPPQTEAQVGTASYHLAAMIRYVHDAYQLVLAERRRIEGLKPIPEPTFTTKLLEEQAKRTPVDPID